MAPLVSVIIPTYNYGRFVAGAIESIQSQSLHAWECIVVDDGSTDDTREVVAAIARKDDRVRYVHQANQGLSAARNTGIRHAAGSYIQLLDADDFLESSKLEVHANYLEHHPDAGLVYGGMRYVSARTGDERLACTAHSHGPWMKGISGSGKHLLRRLLQDNIMVVNCALVRRTVIDRCGPFNERLRANEDWEYWIRCALSDTRFVYLPGEGTLALVRCHAGSMSRDASRMLEAMRAMYGGLEPLLGADQELRAACRRGLARVEMLLALETMRRGHRLDGFRALLKHALRNRALGLLPYGVKIFVVGK
jgi:glycosyltransferase involved in cell wall biosynthesis